MTHNLIAPNNKEKRHEIERFKIATASSMAAPSVVTQLETLDRLLLETPESPLLSQKLLRPPPLLLPYCGNCCSYNPPPSFRPPIHPKICQAHPWPECLFRTPVQIDGRRGRAA